MTQRLIVVTGFCLAFSATVNAADSFNINWTATTDKGLTIKPPASQTANLQEWQNNSGTALSSINSSGQITLGDSSKGVNKFLMSDSNGLGAWSAAHALTGSAVNLILKNSSATQVVVTADELILKDSSSVTYLATSVNVTAAITGSGANGLDTGSEASSTWYYVWVIYNGTTVASLLSTSATAPTMPSGYTYKARVGSVRNDASSNFVGFYQVGKTTYYDSYISTLSAGSATTFTSVSLSTQVPSIATTVTVLLYCTGDATSNITSTCYAGYDGTNETHYTVARYSSTGPDYSRDSSVSTFPLKTAQTIYYYVGSTYLDLYMYVIGYTNP